MRPGIGGIVVIPSLTGGVGASGGVMALLTCGTLATQALTNIDNVVILNTTYPGAFGYITRSGSNLNIGMGGTYLFMLEPQVRQDKNNNVTKFWPAVNGVAVPNSAAVFTAAAINDSNVLSLTFASVLQAGDVVNFHATTSLSLGASLLFTAAAAPAPAVPATLLTVVGYRTGTTPTT